jgi:hypothetical protein
MSSRRFGRTPGGVCSLGLHLVWCPKYRRRVLGGWVARRLDELIEQIAAEHGWQAIGAGTQHGRTAKAKRFSGTKRVPGPATLIPTLP